MPRTITAPNALFAHCKDHFYKRVWYWVNRTGYSFNDILGPAHLGFMKAMATYDPSRGAKFRTHMHRVVDQRIIDWMRSNKVVAYNGDEAEEMAPPVTLTPADSIGFLDEISQLSDLAQEIVQAILDGDVNGGRSGWKVRGNLFRLMRDRGHTHESIRDSFAEIKGMLGV